MVSEDSKQSREDPNPLTVDSKLDENGGIMDSIFSPGFKSLAAMAGWDEEALLLASLVVDDTPEREFKNKKRFVLHCKSTPTSSRRKRRARSGIPDSIPATVLDLGEDEKPVKVSEEKKADPALEQQSCGSSSSSSSVPCMDKLREELSCAICLELCFEPSTTSCGHSFCKKCLRSAADKCGKRCPKCRQLISNGRSCTVNTVLWNTIQLLFPKETEARKTAGVAAIDGDKAAKQIPERAFYNNLQNRNTRESLESSQRGSRSRRRRRPAQEEEGESEQRFERAAMAPSRSSSEANSRSQRRGRGWTPSQDGDAALALRLQREEFMGTFREPPPQEQVAATSSLSLARANLRAMATRAVNVRVRSRHTTSIFPL